MCQLSSIIFEQNTERWKQTLTAITYFSCKPSPIKTQTTPILYFVEAWGLGKEAMLINSSKRASSPGHTLTTKHLPQGGERILGPFLTSSSIQRDILGWYVYTYFRRTTGYVYSYNDMALHEKH